MINKYGYLKWLWEEGVTRRRIFLFGTKLGRNCKKAQSSGYGSGCTPCQNMIYAIKTLHDHEGSLDIVIAMLKVFHLEVYVLLDLGATFSFMTLYVPMKFDIDPKILLEPFSISTLIGDSINAK